jgi:hypothetical protein
MQTFSFKTHHLSAVFFLLFWGVISFLLGYISILLDDPPNRLSAIWLPAGAAVSSFMLSHHTRWTGLFITFLGVQLFLDWLFRHDLADAIVIAFPALLCQTGIALSFRFFSRGHDALYQVICWIISTVVISLPAASLTAFWLNYAHNIALSEGVWMLWSTSVTSIFLLRPSLLRSSHLRQTTPPWLVSGKLCYSHW